MGLYQVKRYTKDKKGNWNCCSCKIENAPHDVKFWGNSKKVESKSNLGEHTFLTVKQSRTGKTKQVANAVTYFGKSEKVSRTLITTSSKLPKKYNGGKYGK